MERAEARGIIHNFFFKYSLLQYWHVVRIRTDANRTSQNSNRSLQGKCYLLPGGVRALGPRIVKGSLTDEGRDLLRRGERVFHEGRPQALRGATRPSAYPPRAVSRFNFKLKHTE